MKFNFTFILLSFFLLLGCVRTTYIFNEAGKDYCPRLVIYSILTEGDSIFVLVKHTIKINEPFNNRDIYVKNAKVILKNDNGDSILLKQVNINDSVNSHLFRNSTYYSASQENFGIMPGKKYYLFVTADGYPSIKAQTTVPQQRDTFISVKLNSYSIEDSINSNYSFTVKWKYNPQYSYLLGNPYDLFQLYYFQDNVLFDNSTQTLICRKYYLDDTLIYLNTLNNDIISYFKYLELTKESNETSLIFKYNGIIPEFNNIDGGYGIFSAFLTFSKNIKINIQ